MPRKKKIQVKCSYCKRSFSHHGYKQHFLYPKNLACKLASDASVGIKADVGKNKAKVKLNHVIGIKANVKLSEIANSFLDVLAGVDNIHEDKKPMAEDEEDEEEDMKATALEEEGEKEEDDEVGSMMQQSDHNDYSDSGNTEDLNAGSSIDNMMEDGGDNAEDSEESSDGSLSIPIEVEIESSFLETFDAYAAWGKQNCESLEDEELAGAELLETIHRKRAPLNTYEAICKWRKKYSKEPVHEKQDYIPRETLITKLLQRYNIKDCMPFKKKVKVASGDVIELVLHSFEAQLMSLLTDPRLVDDDYLFFNEDPLCPPPEDLDYVKDINTGRAYTETWKAKVRIGSNQMLLPIIWYIDGAVTGQYDHLPLTALQFTLGIFNQKTRDKPWAWRSVGYVPKIWRDKFAGNDLFKKSGHMDAGLDDSADSLDSDSMSGISAGADSDSDLNSNSTTTNGYNHTLPGAAANQPFVAAGVRLPEANAKTRKTLQDFHSIISTILHGCGYISMQNKGCDWNLQYKNTTTHVHFILFTLMIKGDTQEHDKHCGKYNSRSGNVKCLCRYCCCPTEESDDPKAKYPMKTPQMINNAIARQEWHKFTYWSQHIIQNAWYDVNFGSHNNRGIHGACPSEMLHQLLLGMFLHCRNTFFEQTGAKSAAAFTINALAAKYGKLLQRQSDRDKARTTFNKGISDGRMMAREYSGVLLVLLVVLRSTKGRQCLMSQRGAKKFFGTQEQISDWMMLLETLIQWEVWLRQESIKTSELRRAQRKHQYIMGLFKKIVKRQAGMGMKLTKFHVILHLIADILDFSVPTAFDTGSNEMAHKGFKTSARQTQKNARQFEFQTARRCIENLAVMLARIEREEGITPWKYRWKDAAEDSVSESDNLSPNADVSGADESGTESDSETSRDTDESGANHDMEDEEEDDECINSGTAFILHYDAKEELYRYDTSKSRSIHDKKKQCDGNQQLAKFIGEEILQKIPAWEDIYGFSEHKRNGQIFRAHPNYRGNNVWNDWVMINWGRPWGVQPGHIWTFLDLENLPTGTNFPVGNTGMNLSRPGVYAVVESAFSDIDDYEIKMSTLLIPIQKEIYSLDPLERKFYLVTVDSFEAPACVVPDIGGNPRAFFRLLPKKKWLSTFVDWLNAPYESLEELDSSSDEIEEDEDEEDSGSEDLEVVEEEEQQSSEDSESE